MCGLYPLCGFQLPTVSWRWGFAMKCTFIIVLSFLRQEWIRQLLLQQGWVRWNESTKGHICHHPARRKMQPKWESVRVDGLITLWRKRCRWSEGLSWEPPMTASPAARSLWSTPEGCDLHPRPPKNLPSGTADTILPTPLQLRRRLAMSPNLLSRCRWDTRRRRSIGRQCYVWLGSLTRMRCQVVTLHPNVSLGDWR